MWIHLFPISLPVHVFISCKWVKSVRIRGFEDWPPFLSLLLSFLSHSSLCSSLRYSSSVISSAQCSVEDQCFSLLFSRFSRCICDTSSHSLFLRLLLSLLPIDLFCFWVTHPVTTPSDMENSFLLFAFKGWVACCCKSSSC